MVEISSELTTEISDFNSSIRVSVVRSMILQSSKLRLEDKEIAM